MDNVKLLDLIDVEVFQQIQDGFSDYTGMAAIITDSNGVPITKGSGFTEFCMELTRNSEEGRKQCEQCDKNGALLTLKNGHATVYKCHAGLIDFAAPIMLNGEFLGSCIGGQVRTGEIDEELLKRNSVQYGIDEEKYLNASRKIECLSEYDVQRAANFIEKIAHCLSKLAYNNYLKLEQSRHMEEVAKSQAEFVMNTSMELQKNVDNWTQRVEEIVQSETDLQRKSKLSTLLQNSRDMSSHIANTIDYIKVSENQVEIMETQYLLSDLAEQLKNGIKEEAMAKNMPTEISLADDSDKKLFGDVGRIGQLINKFLHAIIMDKTEGKIEVSLSTIKRSYAAVLCIEITDFDSNITEEEVEYFHDYFHKDIKEAVPDEKYSMDMRISLTNIIFNKMSCEVSSQREGKNFIIRIFVPQLAI